MDGDARRGLRLSAEAINELLARLDAVAQRAGGANRRRSVRYKYRVGSVVVEFTQSEAKNRHSVHARDISRDGMSFLHSSFVYPGTPCRIRLVSEYNVARDVAARVVRCRYLEGTSNAHEVGVSFDAPIDVAMFNRAASSVRVLIVDDDSMQRGVLAELLKQHQTEVHSAATAKEALEQATNNPYDLILVNMDSESLGGCEFVRELRRGGYVRPISSVSLNSGDATRRHCQEAQCVACAPVTLTRDSLPLIVNSLKTEPVISSLAQQPAMASLINVFVNSVQERINRMETALSKGEFAAMLKLVGGLRLAADQTGFELISTAATTLEAALQKNSEPHALRQLFNDVVRLCLSARPASASDDVLRANETKTPQS